MKHNMLEVDITMKGMVMRPRQQLLDYANRQRPMYIVVKSGIGIAIHGRRVGIARVLHSL